MGGGQKGTYELIGNRLKLSTRNIKTLFVDNYEIVSFENNKMEVSARMGNPIRQGVYQVMLWEKVTEN